MIRIKKVSIENFKGMRSPTEVDFSIPTNTCVNILAGANGFGKTTIFDAIEVCFTGKFHRVKLFNDVQKKNSHRSRPFYQNLDGQDVIIKLLIEKSDTGEQFVIIKHYDDSDPITNIGGGRHNIPVESSAFFLTYITNDVSRFNTNNFDGLPKAGQDEINKLIYGTGAVSLESTYYLFNYIQQEDSLYFLKQSEDTKGKSLSFLFNIVEEEKMQGKLYDICKSLANNQGRLATEISMIKEQIITTPAVEYKMLFSNKQIPFDAQSPFSNPQSSKEQLLQFQEVINELIAFRKIFSPEEFEKHLLFNSLSEEVISKNKILEALLLRKVSTPEIVNNFLSRNDKRNKAETFLKRSNKLSVDDKTFELFITDTSVIPAYKQVVSELQKLDSELGELDRIIGELNQAREKSLSEFEKLAQHKHISDTNCPLCDTAFPSLNDLLTQIKNKTDALQSHNNKRLEERKKLIVQLEEICKKVDTVVLEYIDSNKVVEPEIENILRGLANLNQSVATLTKKHPVLESEEIDQFLFNEIPTSRVEIDTKLSQLKEYLSKSVLVKLEYNAQAIAKKHFYIEYFESNKELFEMTGVDLLTEKLNYLNYTQSQLANNRLQFLIARQNKLERLKTKLDDVNRRFFQTIKDHKVDMIKRIKIPFYVYSGKILQSYQQGSGIFVDIRETDQNNNVRFFTGSLSDHDIVYHLSSGQMAVVALAFCLSLNKVYNTNQDFKFLAIDDPIQTMDDLNVHTFVELLRNEFSDFQIIMSTHDDFTSRYMKYKFDKFGMKTKIQNVQQLVLEQSIN